VQFVARANILTDLWPKDKFPHFLCLAFSSLVKGLWPTPAWCWFSPADQVLSMGTRFANRLAMLDQQGRNQLQLELHGRADS
jgi:hypothetical protein